MYVVIKYKKYGLLRFLSAIETANAIERHLRRSGLKMVFTQGFHKKPKVSYLDPTPTGVINLALYVRVCVEEFSDTLIDNLRQTALTQLYPTDVWVTDLDPNRVVTGYKYRILLDEESIDISRYDEKSKVEVGKKLGLLKDFFMLLSFKKFDRIIALEYNQMRDRTLHPSYLYEPLLKKEPSVLVIQRVEALCYDNVPLKLLLEGKSYEKGLGC